MDGKLRILQFLSAALLWMCVSGAAGSAEPSPAAVVEPVQEPPQNGSLNLSLAVLLVAGLLAVGLLLVWRNQKARR